MLFHSFQVKFVFSSKANIPKNRKSLKVYFIKILGGDFPKILSHIKLSVPDFDLRLVYFYTSCTHMIRTVAKLVIENRISFSKK